MRAQPAILALLLAAQTVGAQVTVVGPGSNQPGKPVTPSEASYGPPRVADLEGIANGEGYQRSHVITDGEIGPFLQGDGQYWTLRQNGATVLIIPGNSFDRSELTQVVGKRTEVRGIVRALREKQYVQYGAPGMKKSTDLDLVEDPLLPPLPPPNFDKGWPRVSITVFAIHDRTSPESSRRKETGGGMGRQILDEPSAYSGKKARIYGQFRGRNLFGDLPAGTARTKEDWVLKDGDTAMWVMGKPPKGDGWRLDPEYKGDSKSWLEVEGKPEVVNGIVYLKASLVLMSKPPSGSKPEPPLR